MRTELNYSCPMWSRATKVHKNLPVPTASHSLTHWEVCSCMYLSHFLRRKSYTGKRLRSWLMIKLIMGSLVLLVLIMIARRKSMMMNRRSWFASLSSECRSVCCLTTTSSMLYHLSRSLLAQDWALLAVISLLELVIYMAKLTHSWLVALCRRL